MSILSFILISFVYFWCSSTALSLGLGYYTLYRPIISGMLTGLILNNVELGMMAGSVVNIIYIDFVSTGGSLKGDQCLTGVIAAVAAILFKLNPIEAAAIAYPFGFAGIFIWKYRLKVNSMFVRKYNDRYRMDLEPDISIYNGLLPQLMLYFISAAVIIISIGPMILLKNLFLVHGKILQKFLFPAGIYLISISIINVLFNLRNYKSIILFFAILTITLIFNLNVYIVITLLAIVILYFTFNDLINVEEQNKNLILNKKDLVYSWFIWMNFSHSCYSYDRLQGFAFAHSMKNIINKLYKDDKSRSININKHTEFFNTEPNMGTPIHGYIISLEEKKSLGDEVLDISYIKKGMMGIAAGLGDSFTQVVLSPLFISMALIISMDGNITAVIFPILLLAATILYISYSGFMYGYYIGRETLITRINKIKNNKIKKYFPLIFSGIIGMLIGKLIIINYLIIKTSIVNTSIVILLAFIYSFIKRRSVKA